MALILSPQTFRTEPSGDPTVSAGPLNMQPQFTMELTANPLINGSVGTQSTSLLAKAFASGAMLIADLWEKCSNIMFVDQS